MSEERPIEDVHADLVTAISDAVKAMLVPQPRQHKHGLMGTNPNTRRQAADAPVDPDDPWGMMERGSGYGLFMKGSPVDRDAKMEEWHETEVPPWGRPADHLGHPTDRDFYYRTGRWPRWHQQVRQAILDFPSVVRLVAVWKTLRYGPGYWTDW